MLRAAGFCFLAFLVLALLVGSRLLAGFDDALIRAAQSSRDCTLYLASSLAHVAFALEVSVALCAGLSFWLWRQGFGVSALAPWLVFASLISEVSFKLGVPQPGPSGALIPSHWGCTTGPGYPLPLSWTPPNTFPSGYAARAGYFAVLATGLARQWMPRALPWVAGGAGALVAALAFTRVYVAWHWPTDVLGGLLLGASLAFVTRHVLAHRPSWKGRHRSTAAH